MKASQAANGETEQPANEEAPQAAAEDIIVHPINEHPDEDEEIDSGTQGTVPQTPPTVPVLVDDNSSYENEESNFFESIYTYFYELIFGPIPTGDAHDNDALTPPTAEQETARANLDDAKRELRDLEDAKSKLESTLAKDFGPQKEYYALYGSCYDYKTREYTYTICPFTDAKQGHTNLGKFIQWHNNYSVMEFGEGQQCWGGPKRSLKVKFQCGTTNEALNVGEPSKCEYAMDFATPAACDAKHLQILELELSGSDDHATNYKTEL